MVGKYLIYRFRVFKDANTLVSKKWYREDTLNSQEIFIRNCGRIILHFLSELFDIIFHN